MSAAEFLKNVSFFSELAEEELNEIAKVGRTVNAPAEEIIFQEGDEADRLYIILTGRVRIAKRDESGQAAELAELGAGKYFGELALIDGGARSATTTTIEACEFFTLERDAFLALLSRSSTILTNLFSGLSSRIRSANEKIYKEAMLLARQEIEKHRAISEMVAGVAHEVNTPIGIVNTAASVITESLSDKAISEWAKDDDAKEELEDLRDAATLIQSNVARAAKLIESFKKISANQVAEERVEVDIIESIREIVDLFEIQGKKMGITVEFSHDVPAENRLWDGYPGYLSQILLNFLQNAERYAYPGGIGGTVEVRLGEGAGGYELVVKDKGQGMSKEVCSKIFDAFFTTGRERGGTGLGMAIVHNLVTESLGGTIDVQSAEGEGTCLSVCIPMQLPDGPING